ncbi:piggyBac transposable element-derived protein 4-like [Xyrichtys novacula]|uniref:PiggyBac transposable element-derived protein 4-like n=1 Tax=Xyrichtys novacula TaxID=13765 RepID=A0AAV1FT22_XYRNO|nr:piggyBac transposable element-derived protein 4-like [Xyrichtys novacula]
MTYTPLELFKLFFSDDVLQTLRHHTNKNARKKLHREKKYPWQDLSPQELQKFLGLNFYCALLKLSAVQDYQEKNKNKIKLASLFLQVSYQGIIFLVISWNIHVSDPDKHDCLFHLKPILVSIQDACKAFYQPRQNIAMDERILATKAHTGMTQYMKAKPTKWGFKLFVLADSSNSYTVDFAVYTGKWASI